MTSTFRTLLVLGIAFLPTWAIADDAEEIAKLKERIELLEAELKAVTLERDALQKQLDESQSTRGADDKPKFAPLNSTWTGKFKAVQPGKSSTSNAQCSVIKREGKKATFRATIENGAVWEFDAEFSGPKLFKIVGARRLQAADAVADAKDLPPAGGVVGKGNADTRKLSISVVWKDAPGGPLKGESDYVLDEAPESK